VPYGDYNPTRIRVGGYMRRGQKDLNYCSFCMTTTKHLFPKGAHKGKCSRCGTAKTRQRTQSEKEDTENLY
jgi:rRNA maturation endonuclease Nob1